MINNQMTVIPFNEPPSYPYSYCEYSGKELDNLSIVVSAEAERLNLPQDTFCRIQREYNFVYTHIKDMTNF